MRRNNSYLYATICPESFGVTGSCLHTTIDFLDEYGNKKETHFLIDCGLNQGKSEGESEELNDPNSFLFDPKSIEAVFLTHAHADHCGRLPILPKLGFKGKIFCYKKTEKLTKSILENSAAIHEQTAKQKKQKPLYTAGDVTEALGKFICCEFNKTFKFTPNIDVTFLTNEHMLGSAMILFEIADSFGNKLNILFTGDYNDTNVLFNTTESLPDRLRQMPLHMVIESTYGSTTSDSIKEEFRKDILEELKSDKFILIPAFSMERTQRILYELKVMQEEGLISPNKILLDGNLSKEMTLIYKNDETIKDFLPKNFDFISNEGRMELLNHLPEKTIVLTPSGMGTFGPARAYIPQIIAKENASIIFTGYLAEDTVGRKIKDAMEEETVSIFGQNIKKKAKVFFVEEFSSHAKADILIKFLSAFENIKSIGINHGSPESKKAFKNLIVNELVIDSKKIYIFERGMSFRIDKSRLVKNFR